jgi:membrane protease YdiL (CAAX protease family)
MLSARPWKLIDFLVVMALLFMLLVGGIFSNFLAATRGDVALDTQTQAINFAVSLAMYGAIVALVHLMVVGRQSNWGTAFGFTSTRQLAALLMALGITCIVLPIAWYLGDLSAKVMEEFHRKAVPQQSVQVLQTSVSAGPQIFLAILAIVVAPVTEELLFRGILFAFIKQRGYPKLALWGTAVLFGALHLNLMTFIPLTFLGLVLAWLYDATDNLVAPIFAHSLFNLANFIRAVWEHQVM